jgi:hypothetical protein
VPEADPPGVAPADPGEAGEADELGIEDAPLDGGAASDVAGGSLGGSFF